MTFECEQGMVGGFTNSTVGGGACTEGEASFDADTEEYMSTSRTGGDIWDGGDVFHYQYFEVSGDFDLSIQFTERSHSTGAGRWGKFGLMARETLDHCSRFTMVQDHLPGDDPSRVAGRRRHLSCGDMFEVQNNNGAAVHPTYIRLTRRGSVVQGWTSEDPIVEAEPEDDANWAPGFADDWSATAAASKVPERLLVGFANSEHVSGSSDEEQRVRFTIVNLNEDPVVPPPGIPPDTLADSLFDFDDGAQGVNGFSSGYFNLTQDSDGGYDVDDFVQFENDGTGVISETNQWDGAVWRLSADPTTTGGPWTVVGPTFTHPNGTNSTPGEEHWSVRRWVSDDSGDVCLAWTMAKAHPLGAGATGQLFVNGEQVDSATILGTATNLKVPGRHGFIATSSPDAATYAQCAENDCLASGGFCEACDPQTVAATVYSGAYGVSLKNGGAIPDASFVDEAAQAAHNAGRNALMEAGSPSECLGGGGKFVRY